MKRLPRFEDAFIGYHYVLAAGIGIAYGLIEYLGAHAHLVGRFDGDTRSTFYLSLAGQAACCSVLA